ncbi:non-specific serine/threonine protein kinase [Lentzea atacamensis]|uniref:non-specific serine/threonine protein kinase n=1 Tax=Lentzea atacamensis TaxID=531938 RepID=A0A316HL01_9PSEU|nr:serine/threonine-protein kinase [Lentzea atacamensis]PWK80866.1 non-specific serine/threonine protein kinase [Lentzea atacamensis]RAS66710.1 non-specific serine/threonine protein kinase [Lentzea atacamensis]
MLIADRYEIDDLPLGRGGMGAVHEGRDLRLDRRVAVKLLRLPGSDDEVRQRFAREARIVAKLEHPGVPVLYDFGTYDQRLFQVMQFVDGVTVADLVQEFGPLPEAWAATIAAQAAAVLTEAHEHGICHRDLKPTNLMLCPDGAVKVLDFGLALLRESDVAPFSRAGQILGTPSYMAPEQIQRGTAEPRSDLYALGCVLHEMLTGEQLFTGPTAYAVFDKHVKEPPRRLRSTLDPIVQRMLAKEPADRPATARDVFADLQGFAQNPPPLPGFVQNASTAAMYASVQLRPGSGSPRDRRSPTGAAPRTPATVATPPSA